MILTLSVSIHRAHINVTVDPAIKATVIHVEVGWLYKLLNKHACQVS